MKSLFILLLLASTQSDDAFIELTKNELIIDQEFHMLQDFTIN